MADAETLKFGWGQVIGIAMGGISIGGWVTTMYFHGRQLEALWKKHDDHLKESARRDTAIALLQQQMTTQTQVLSELKEHQAANHTRILSRMDEMTVAFMRAIRGEGGTRSTDTEP